MANAFTRGSAPGRAREDWERKGSFQKGHAKVGGRRKGTPNAMSRDYTNAILEAAYRVGMDGNGVGGIVGYFMWIAACYPQVYVPALIRLLELESSYSASTDRPAATVREINDRLRQLIGLTGSKTASNQRLTAKPELLDELIRIANEAPGEFFKLIIAMPPRPRTRRGSV